MPKEADGENFNDALVRVCRCINGGTATENADSDSDIEVVSNSVTINLRCPVSSIVNLPLFSYLEVNGAILFLCCFWR